MSKSRSEVLAESRRKATAAGATTNLPRAIFAYNHAQWYVDQVLQLASLFGDANSELARFNRLQSRQ